MDKEYLAALDEANKPLETAVWAAVRQAETLASVHLMTALYDRADILKLMMELETLMERDQDALNAMNAHSDAMEQKYGTDRSRHDKESEFGDAYRSERSAMSALFEKKTQASENVAAFRHRHPLIARAVHAINKLRNPS